MSRKWRSRRIKEEWGRRGDVKDEQHYSSSSPFFLPSFLSRRIQIAAVGYYGQDFIFLFCFLRVRVGVKMRIEKGLELSFHRLTSACSFLSEREGQLMNEVRITYIWVVLSSRVIPKVNCLQSVYDFIKMDETVRVFEDINWSIWGLITI